MKTLYFDIDGVLLSYEETQRPLLSGGTFQNKLKCLGFDRLVCVSGWSDIYNTEVVKKSELAQKRLIHALLSDIFPDQDWFLERLQLVYDTDARCKHIDLNEDWFYIDDWADKFFPEAYGKDLYAQETGKRILLANPHGNGSDILTWLDEVVPQIT